MTLQLFEEEELRELKEDTMRALYSSRKLWLKPCFFRYENQQNHAFSSITLNGTEAPITESSFWRRSIIQDLRLELRQQLDPSLNGNLDAVGTRISQWMMNNGSPPGWETLANDISLPFYGKDVRSRIDRLLPLTMSYPQLYTFIDRFFFLAPSDTFFLPTSMLALDLQNLAQNGPAPAGSAAHHAFIANTYDIDGVDIDARGSTLFTLNLPGLTAIAITGDREANVYDMVLMNDNNYRDLLLSRFYNTCKSWTENESNPPISTYRQLVSGYVVGIAEFKNGMILRHVQNEPDGQWACKVAISLGEGPRASFQGGTGSVRQDPWLLLAQNVTCDNSTFVVTWDTIPRFTLAEQTPIHRAMRHFLCETFVSSANLDISSAYKALYRDNLPDTPQVTVMKLSAIWRSLCAMYDSRNGMFEKNMNKLATRNRPSIGQMMAQVVARDPVAYSRALRLFIDGQSVYGGGRGNATMYSSTLPVQSFNTLKSAVIKLVPPSSVSAVRRYIASRHWEQGNRLTIT